MAATSSPPIPEAALAAPVAALPGFRHAYAEVNGTRLHYVIGGEGPAVVLLHGWPYTWAVWRQLLPLLVKAGYTAIAPNLRGLGDSAKAGSGYAKTNVSQDVYELTQQLGYQEISGN
jgi:pimeloyl-ACP methyl ester carboxylesterase